MCEIKKIELNFRKPRLIQESTCVQFRGTQPLSKSGSGYTPLSTMTSKTLTLCSPLNVRGQVSHPYNKRKNYSDSYFNWQVFRQKTGRQETVHQTVVTIDKIQSAHNFITFINTDGGAVLHTNWKVAGLIPDGVIGILHWHNPSGRTMALGSTQASYRNEYQENFLGVNAAGA